MAHKKAGGSSRNGRDTAGRRLGIKKFGGEHVIPGNIGIGTDHTIFAVIEGKVSFATKRNGRIYISVDPMLAQAAE
jgi:large subunit ribosomal protein L27